jgi:serine protease Do
LFRQFFGNQFPPSARPHTKSAALGTGFVIDPSGIILTNNHVVAGADEITVQFTENADEKPTKAKVIGRDPELDIALIRVKPPEKLQALALGDSDALEVGEYVMAVGNPFGNGHSVTHGIVSAKGRNVPGEPLASWLQIDAPINPGNSGGPLLNMKGEVVGINNAIDARAQGIGFAIPINYVKQVLAQLEDSGKVQRGYIGAVIGALTPEIAEKIAVPKSLRAPFVTQITPGSPAEKAGLQPYDVITAVKGTQVHTPQDLVRAITSSGIGQSVALTINRAGAEQRLSIRTEQRPSAEVALNERGTQDSEPNATGLSLQKAQDGKGVVVAGVEPGSTAEEAGLRPGDEILEVDRKPVKSSEQFNRLVRNGKSYLVRVKRSDPAGQDSYSVVVLETNRSNDKDG